MLSEQQEMRLRDKLRQTEHAADYWHAHADTLRDERDRLREERDWLHAENERLRATVAILQQELRAAGTDT